MLDTLRFVTYLAPSIPAACHRALAEQICGPLGLCPALTVEERRSGPRPHEDPFSADEGDVGFMCAPCYLDLRALPRPPVELLVAPVYADPRNGGRPVYFSEVMVRRDAGFTRFEDFARSGTWAFNDDGSLSGYHCMRRRLAALGLEPDARTRAVHSGSHLRSLELVAAGEVDGAAIDSHVLALRQATAPESVATLRVLATLGPHPVQPVVVRASLAQELKLRLRERFLGLDAQPRGRELLSAFRVERFVPVEPSDYPLEFKP